MGSNWVKGPINNGLLILVCFKFIKMWGVPLQFFFIHHTVHQIYDFPVLNDFNSFFNVICKNTVVLGKGDFGSQKCMDFIQQNARF